MLLHGKILAGRSETINTKKGPLQKTKLRVVDLGDETQGDLSSYWIDFLGDASMSDAEIDQVLRKELSIEVRRVSVSMGSQGKAFLNVTGGAILDANDVPVQAKLRDAARRSA